MIHPEQINKRNKKIISVSFFSPHHSVGLNTPFSLIVLQFVHTYQLYTRVGITVESFTVGSTTHRDH